MPGYKCSVADTLRMSHNVLKAHGRAVQMLREYAPDAQVGFAPTCGIPYPASDKAEDVEAARQVMFSVPKSDNWTWNVPWWSDPVLLGHYPEKALRRSHKELPNITKEDLKLISEPIDIYGQNIYMSVIRNQSILQKMVFHAMMLFRWMGKYMMPAISILKNDILRSLTESYRMVRIFVALFKLR